MFKIEGETLIAKTLSSISTLKIAPNRVYISLYKESQVAELLPHLSSLVFKDDHRGSAYLLRPPGDPGREIPVEFVFDEERPDLPENRAAIWGIMRVLQEVPAGYVQIIPCDTPFFNADVINALHEELEDLADAAALVPRWKNGYIEPLHTIYNKEAMIEKIKINVDRRNFKLRNLFEGCHSVKFFDIEEKLGRIDPSHKAFKNLNNLDDLSG